MAGARYDGFFPGRALLDAYGNGGFRFAEMSHRGSIVCLPSGIWAWPPASAADIDVPSLQRAMDEAPEIEMLLIGTGDTHVPLRVSLRETLREAGLRVDVMATGAASRTYNVLLSDQRKVAAALIAVENAR